MDTRQAGLTIVITSCNHECVLPSSVESALNAIRTVRALDVMADILVIDDGSRDGSLTLLRQLEAFYFADGLRLLALEESEGPARVRNFALRHATYDYVVLMDADAELVPGSVYHFYRSIRETAAAVVYGTVICRGQTHDRIAVKNNESFRDRLFTENYLDAFALYDRRQTLDSGGFSEHEMLREAFAWEFYLHLAVNGRRIVFVPLIFGIQPIRPEPPATETDTRTAAVAEHIRRVFDPLGQRQRRELTTRHLRYHPDLGYL